MLVVQDDGLPTPTPVGVAGGDVWVYPLGLACCALELAAALRQLPAGSGGTLPRAHVLVIAGTVTPRLAPLVAAAWAAMPRPRAAVAFGACTISGGPYWDSPAVLPGIESLIPAAVRVPGCPPDPSAVLGAIVVAAQDRAGAS